LPSEQGLKNSAEFDINGKPEWFSGSKPIIGVDETGGTGRVVNLFSALVRFLHLSIIN
jgi:hypothetical protein